MQLLGRRQLALSIGALLSGTALARVLSAVGLLLMARLVGREQFGQYAACWSLARLSAVVFSLGFESWLLHQRSSERELLARRTSAALLVEGALGLAWLAGLVALSTVLPASVFPLPVLMLVAVVVWTEQLATVVWSAFKAALQNRITFLLLTLYQLLLFGVTAGLVLAGVEALQPYLLLRAAASVVAVTLTLAVLVWQLGLPFVPEQLWAFTRASLPFALSMLLTLLYERADVVIIGFWLGEEQAGLYAPAVTLMSSLFLIPAALFGVLVPLWSRLYATRGRAIWSSARTFLLGSSGLGLLMAGGVALLAHPLIRLVYGDEFRAAGDVLVVLSAILFLRCLTFVAASLIVAVGRQQQRVVVQAMAAALNVGLNLALVQRVGIVGVAGVYVLSEAVLMLGYLLLIRRWLHQPSERAPAPASSITDEPPSHVATGR